MRGAPAHTGHEGGYVRLHPRALMHMRRCESPRCSVSRPGAMVCSVAYHPGYFKGAVWAVRGRARAAPSWRTASVRPLQGCAAAPTAFVVPLLQSDLSPAGPACRPL